MARLLGSTADPVYRPDGNFPDDYDDADEHVTDKASFSLDITCMHITEHAAMLQYKRMRATAFII